MKHKSCSPEETIAFGVRIGRLLKSGDVVALEGDLGAGKTHLSKGIAEGLGVAAARENVTSPTFSLINEYAGRIKIYHLDWYRLKSVDGPDLEMACECFESAAVTLVEWAERGSDILPEEHIIVRMNNQDPSTRLIEVSAAGKKYAGFLSALEKKG